MQGIKQQTSRQPVRRSLDNLSGHSLRSARLPALNRLLPDPNFDSNDPGNTLQGRNDILTTKSAEAPRVNDDDTVFDRQRRISEAKFLFK